MDVVKILAFDRGDGLVLEPDGFLNRIAVRIVLADQVCGFVVGVVGFGAGWIGDVALRFGVDAQRVFGINDAVLIAIRIATCRVALQQLVVERDHVVAGDSSVAVGVAGLRALCAEFGDALAQGVHDVAQFVGGARVDFV